MDVFSERVLFIMNRRDYTYADLEKLTGISDSTLQRYVTKSTKKVPLDKAEIIAKALDVDIAWLLGWEDENDNKSVDFNTMPSNVIPLPKMTKVPLIGKIACGEPITAVENIDGYVSVPESAEASFALRCQGDSMVGARIMDGDIVFIRSQPDVEDGEIAAVLIDDEATLKRVYKMPNRLTLRAENPKYPPKDICGEALNDVRILGKAVCFLSEIF